MGGKASLDISGVTSGSRMCLEESSQISDENAVRDEDLVHRALSAPAGDLRAFEELVRRHQGRVLANCRYMSGSADDAEDLAQEVFIKVYFGLQGFAGRASFTTWLRRIKVNHCLNYLRRRKGERFVELGGDWPEGEGAVGRVPVASGADTELYDHERVKRVLNEMSGALRIALVMREMDELSYQEIADHLGIGLSAVKMRIKRGREMFRQLYMETQEDGTEAPVPSGDAGA